MKLGELYTDDKGQEYVVYKHSGVGFEIRDIETETRSCYYNPREDNWLKKVKI